MCNRDFNSTQTEKELEVVDETYDTFEDSFDGTLFQTTSIET